MVSEKLTVVNKLGFHMRPASRFVQAMAKYKSDIHILCNGKDVDGKSILILMAAGIKCGAAIELRCDGPDEEAMLKEAAALVRSGLGEA